jgi:thiamine transport system ATP-binding protein
VLELRNVTISYQNQRLLKNIALVVESNEIVSLVGPSGSGKTTLLRVIAGLEKPSTGSVLVNGVNISHQPTHLRGIGLVFQDNQLFPHLTVEGNIGYSLRMRGINKLQRAQHVAQMLELMGLERFATRSVQQLSGGEAKRVAVARSLIAQPSVLLLDEPLTGLDSELRDRLLTDVAAILRSRGTTVVHVTHDLYEAAAFSDRVVNIHELGPVKA